MKCPRVLVSGVVLSQPMGGVRRHNQELLPRVARRLNEGGGGLSILEGSEPVALTLPDGMQRIPSDVPLGPPSLRALQEGRALNAAVEDARRAGRPFDLVHTGHLPVPLRLSLPLTLTLHDLRSAEASERSFPRRMIAGRAIRLALKTASLVFTVSEHVGGELQNRFELSPEKWRLLSNAADHFDPLPRRAAHDAPLVHIGHLESRKNLGLLLEALALEPDLPQLDLHGAPKPSAAEELIEQAVALGVRDRVRLCGPFDEGDLPGILAGAACLVMPSRLEGFGIPVLEAQRAGVPVAIADAGALPEVAGPDAPRFATDDARECADAALRAIRTEPAVLATAAERASAFTWDRSATRWTEEWTALLASTRADTG